MFKWIKYTEGATLPVKAHKTDAGWDLCANEDFSIGPGETVTVPTGIGIEWPERIYQIMDNARSGMDCDKSDLGASLKAFVIPRSGLAEKQNITIVNSPGLIDFGYTGEIKVILHKLPTMADIIADRYNLHVAKSSFKKGDRIAQLVFNFDPTVSTDIELLTNPYDEFINLEDLKQREGSRGNNGFGSSGV